MLCTLPPHEWFGDVCQINVYNYTRLMFVFTELESWKYDLLNFISFLQKFYNECREILDLLHQNNFTTVMCKIRMLNIDTQNSLEGLVLLVHKKAISHYYLSEDCAALCSKLSTVKVWNFLWYRKYHMWHWNIYNIYYMCHFLSLLW